LREGPLIVERADDLAAMPDDLEGVVLCFLVGGAVLTGALREGLDTFLRAAM